MREDSTRTRTLDAARLAAVVHVARVAAVGVVALGGIALAVLLAGAQP